MCNYKKVYSLRSFEDDKYVSGLFEELWEEYTSGERVTLLLYLGEIVSLITESISSSSWASKRKVSLAFLFYHMHLCLVSPHSMLVSFVDIFLFAIV